MILWYYTYDSGRNRINVGQKEFNEMKTLYKNNVGTVVKKSDIGKLDSYLQMYLIKRDDSKYAEKICDYLLQTIERCEDAKRDFLNKYDILYNEYIREKELVR